MDTWGRTVKKILFICSFAIFMVIDAFCVQAGVEMTIRYYDKRVYYPGSNIPLKVEIRNNSPDTFTFRVADIRSFNLDFEVKTLSNLALEHSEEFIIQRNSNQHIYYRSVDLKPGEEYAFVEDLSSYIDIKNPGTYVLKGFFFPQFQEGQDASAIVSNSLTLSVRPAIASGEIAAQIDEETGEILKREALPPDQVVEYTIRSRQKSQWEKFFLYLDAESLMLKDPNLKASYQRQSDDKRRAMVEDYKNRLRQERVDRDILMIPAEFEILKTTYTATNATVLVKEKFAYPGFTEIKQYTYYLVRRDKVWYIENYDVRNLGTE
jgi:hypothetical protein